MDKGVQKASQVLFMYVVYVYTFLNIFLIFVFYFDSCCESKL